MHENHLVSAAMPLLLLLIKFKNTLTHPNVSELRRQALGEISAFETRAKNAECSPRLILAARYCLCTAIDEVVLLTPWGNESTWAQQSLLSIVHQETWGGERFFIILEKMAENPQQNLFLLELLYLILSLGFEGKYYNQENTVHDEIRHKLYRLIRTHREEPSCLLSPSLTHLGKKTPMSPIIKKWQIALAAAGLIFISFFIFNLATYFSARKTLQELNNEEYPAKITLVSAVRPQEQR